MAPWHSALFRATGNTTDSFGHPQYMTGTDKAEWVWLRATEMLRGTELCEERLWEMGRYRLEKKRLWGADSRSPGPTQRSVHRAHSRTSDTNRNGAGVT